MSIKNNATLVLVERQAITPHFVDLMPHKGPLSIFSNILNLRKICNLPKILMQGCFE